MNTSRPTETVVVLGASPNPESYAHKALELLREYGHRAIPINFDEILNEKCYPKISAVPDTIDRSCCISAKPAPSC